MAQAQLGKQAVSEMWNSYVLLKKYLDRGLSKKDAEKFADEDTKKEIAEYINFPNQ